MAAVTLLGSATFNTTSGTKTVVATPAVGDLIVIVQAHSGNTSNALPTDNNPDGFGQYVQINTCTAAAGVDTMKMFVRLKLVGSASSTTFTTAPGTTTGGGLAVMNVTGMSRIGANAVRQSAVQSNQAGGGTPTPVLGSAALTGNALIGSVLNATSPATMTPRASPAWTERNDSGYATPTTGLETMSINSGETGTSIAWGGTSASAFGSMVVELDTTVPAPPQSRSRFTDGNSAPHLASLGAALFGSAVLWSIPPQPPPAAQPKPQAAQWENATRQHDQPAPQFGRGVFTAVAAQAQPGKRVFAGPQDDTSQVQPQFSKAQPGNLAPARGQWFATRQDDPSQTGPAVWRFHFANVAPTPGQKFTPAHQDQFQPQPQVWKRQLTTAAAPQPTRPFFLLAAQDTTQPAPQVWRQHLDFVAIAAGHGTVSPHQDPFQPAARVWGRLFAVVAAPQPTGPFFTPAQQDQAQPAPQFFKAQPGNLAPATRQFFATRQDDPSQTQPQVWRQQLGQAAAPQPFGQWFVGPPGDATQEQPRFWRAQFQNVATIPRQWFVPGQGDPSQIAPRIAGQVPPSQATQTPPNRAWFARPQADTTQIQPAVHGMGTSHLPSVPSVSPPTEPEVTGGWPIPRVRHGRRDKERAEQALRAAEEEVEQHERALIRAKSEKTRERERARLATAEKRRAEQERLLVVLTAEIAREMRGQTEAQEMADHAAMLAEEEAVIALFLRLM